MRQPLWVPSHERIAASNLSRFMEQLNRTHGLNVSSYQELYQWSVDEIADFWATMWDFAELKTSRPYDVVIEDLRRFPGAYEGVER